MRAILSAPQNKVKGFLAAGHVCTVMGYVEYEPIAEEFKVPIIVTGFEPLDILEGIYLCVKQLEELVDRVIGDAHDLWPEALAQSIGGEGGVRREFAGYVDRVMNDKAEGVFVKYPELPYFLEEAREQGFAIPLTEALYYFCGAVEPDRLDNVGRPTVSFWKELIERHTRPHTSNW